MSNTDNGGPAFPKAGLDPWGQAKSVQTGVSLRDYFATHAPTPAQDMNLGEHCAYRYRYADTMLSAREMQPADPVRDAAPVLLEAAHRALFLLAGPPWKPSDINLARRVLEDAIAKDTGQEGA